MQNPQEKHQECESANAEFRRRVYASYLTTRTQSEGSLATSEFSSRAPYLRRLVSAHFPKDRAAAILELGCGCGSLIRIARDEGFKNIQGVDVSVEQVELAKQLDVKGIAQGDLFERIHDVPSGSLDVVIAFDVIEHLSKAELLRLGDEVVRALVPGGRWIVHAPNGESPNVGRILYGDITHEIAFTRQSAMQFAAVCGFTRVACYEDEPVAHGITSAIRLALWKVIRLMRRFAVAVETGDIGRDAIFSQNMLIVAYK